MTVDAIRAASEGRLLTADEERALGELARAGDEDAVALLVERNRPLAWSVAMAYADRGVDLDDLAQEAMIGLLTAARKFDPSKGRFTTIAQLWCRQSVARAVQNSAHAIRIPCHLWRAMAAVQRSPDEPDAVIAVRIGAEPYHVAQARRAMGLRRLVSLDAPCATAEGDGTERYDVLSNALAPDDPLAPREPVIHDDGELVDALLSCLAQRERHVLTLHYGLDGRGERNLQQIGTLLGVTRERARQLRNVALDRLRAVAAGRGIGEEVAA